MSVSVKDVMATSDIRQNALHQDEGEWLACHECDAVFRKQAIDVRFDAYCPRCGCHLYASRPDTVRRTLALSLTGLILFFPAVLLPIIGLDVLGMSNSATLIAAVMALFNEGYWWTSFLVLACSIAVPLIEMLSLTVVLIAISLDHYNPWVKSMFKFWHLLKGWGMLEVYLIGVLVSMVKLLDMASVHIGLGLYAFIGMLLMTLLMTLSLDTEEVWEFLEQGIHAPVPHPEAGSASTATPHGGDQVPTERYALKEEGLNRR
ncbi:paraquat-inducible protein A [Pokkaliibacter plantistimulans]|uniref:Paraquat-inducible protein A n=2 Tax=Pseudomonadota TaxID=1224 RepID=A0A2S5KMM2_9PROT|nr:paraquat-inducible protein A [Pokkaliibacter plantistimulans]